MGYVFVIMHAYVLYIRVCVHGVEQCGRLNKRDKRKRVRGIMNHSHLILTLSLILSLVSHSLCLAVGLLKVGTD